MIESEVNVISQASYLNELEIMMTNGICNDWLMEEKYQQRMIVPKERISSMTNPTVMDTFGVVSDNSVVSFGDYSFNRSNKIVVRKKTKKNESLVMWTSKLVTPEDKAFEAASVIGAFTALNYEQAEEVCKEIHSLRG